MTALQDAGLTAGNTFDNEREALNWIPVVAQALSVPQSDFSISTVSAPSSLTSEYDTYTIVSASMSAMTVTEESLVPGTDDYKTLQANGYLNPEELKSQLGWHGKNYDDAVPDTIAFEAASFFPAIQPSPDGEGLDPEHLKDIGVVVYRAYLDPAEGNKVSVEPVEAFAGSLYKDDKDPNTGVTKFIDTIINT